MLKSLKRVAAITMAGLMAFQIGGPTAQAATTLYETTQQETLAGGLRYDHKAKLTEAGWVDVYALVADLTAPNLNVKVLRGDDLFGNRGNLTDMAEKDSTIAGAINGSFFSMGANTGEVIGVEVADEQITYALDDYNYWQNNAANLVIQEGNAFMDYLSISMTLETKSGQSIRVAGVNTRSVGAEPVVFNRNAFATTEAINGLANMFKVVVEKDRITRIFTENETIDIPKDGYVIVFKRLNGSEYLPYFNVGDPITFRQVRNFNLDAMAMAIPGGGFILKEGNVVEEGLLVAPGARHPRTAVGLTKDGKTLVAMVVDGRGSSIGATHSELAQYLKEYGVHTAIHMDGGGSSTLVARDLGDFGAKVKNAPSDGRQRAVVNGLAFEANGPKTTAFNLFLKGDQERIFVDNKVTLSLKAADLNFNPVAVEENMIAWSMSGGYGVINGMTFLPQTPGNITLTAQYKGQKASLNLEVVDTLIDLEIIPKTIHFDDGIQTLTVMGTDEMGHRSIINNDLLTWSISEDVGRIADGVFYPGSEGGNARIDVTYKGIKEVAYVISGDKRESLAGMRDIQPGTLVYPETVKGEVQKIDGATLLAYNFEPSEVSQALYATFEGLNIARHADQLLLDFSGYNEEVLVKGQLSDTNGEQYTITFDERGRANLPAAMAYPVAVKRLYVATYPTDKAKSGTLIIKDIQTLTKTTAADVDDLYSFPPADDLMRRTPEEDSYTVRIFGATAGRNRLLDEVILRKLYSEFNEADYAVYAGKADVDEGQLTSDHFIYADSFSVTDMDALRFITLGMGKGSLVKTDSRQWQKLNEALSATVQPTLVVLGTEALTENDNDAFSKEGQAIHDMLSKYGAKSGKSIFYINASGYSNNLSFYEGIRYIDLNGLWYKVGSDRQVDLYDSFQTLNLYVKDGKVTYSIEDLFPKTQTK